MGLGTGLWSLRRLGVAWLRMAAAMHLALGWLPLLLGSPDLIGVYLPPLVAVATPLVLFHGRIAQKERPWLKRGYWIVALYGPGLLLAAYLLRPPLMRETGDAAMFLLAGLFYEIAAFAVSLTYVGLWSLGDRLLGPEEAPRKGRRWAMGALLLTGVTLYVPWSARVAAEDSCLDAGGRVLAGGWCDMGRSDP